MILAMIEPRCHLANRTLPGLLVKVTRLSRILAFVGLLTAAPVFSQTPASTSTPAVAGAGAPSEKTSLPSPKPDKSRARTAFQNGRRAEQAGDRKTEFAAYSEAATYDPTNREYAMLREHARFQVVQSLVDQAERQEIAGNTPGARDL